MPAFILLALVVVLNTSSTVHSQILKLGENVWDGYFELRNDPVLPQCNVDMDIDSELSRLIYEANNAPADEFDLFDEPEVFNETAIRASLEGAKKQCATKHEFYENNIERITPAVKAFRSVDFAVAELGLFGLHAQRIILALLVIICALTATLSRHHISLRPAITVVDHRVSAFAQFLANAILLFSVYSYRDIAESSGVGVTLQHGILHNIWIAGFATLSLLSIYQFIYPPKDARPGGNVFTAQLAIPLYATMAIIAGTYFISSGHDAGIGIYLNQMMELSQLFLNVGLYVWVGMLLKRTRMAEVVFNVFRPLKLPPEVLAFVVIMIAALPTAYTGASGIFVIAVGSLIYLELRRAGARRQLALAATAMSGSMGVVLRPCLLVVIIAALNKEITTDQLFGWGLKVFVLTAFLFAFFAIVTRQSKLTCEKPSIALPQMLEACKGLVPYIVIITAILLAYGILLDAYLDEFSAPFILPVLLLAVLIYERAVQEKVDINKVNANYVEERVEKGISDLKDGKDSLENTLRSATSETTGHIGALLMLMGLSVSIGGVVERAHLMGVFPETFASIWVAMALLVCVLVVIGMIMDPYGAVILVSATISTVAYKSGIEPIHFWMVTLVAFELGYLSPPVALNHLLTRQVVGEEEVRLASLEGHNFWFRHEKILLPIAVMATALLLVAFVPLMIGYN
jgi:TRAP-type C4-dicarboxylate transport system permease large subunit